MSLGELVIEVKRGIEFQIRDPGPVQKPCHGRVGPDDVVPGLFIFSLEGIRIVLGVHSSEISCQSGLESEHLAEGVAVGEGHPASGV